MPMWRRSGPRRLSTSRVNVRRRLTRRVTSTIVALVIAGGYFAWNNWIAPETVPAPDAAAADTRAATPAAAPGATPAEAPGETQVETLIAERRGGEMVTVTATVARLLADDKDGAAHQKFLLELPSGKRVLVAHNIDLAPRVDGLHKGATVTVRGEFEWNERGGVIHWTHHDPAARHQGGWIRFDGRKYE